MFYSILGVNEDEDNVENLDDGKRMEIAIYAAKDLSKADTFGQSDPFCIVKFNDREIGMFYF